MLEGTEIGGILDFKMIDGVDIFFVLSGYLIGGILLRSFSSKDKITGKHLMNFWKRRWFRTLPNYYLILLLNYIVVSRGIIHEDISQFNFSFLIFSHNLITPFQGFFWESWSLSIEEWFYVVVPILIFLLCKTLNVRRAFLSATLMIIILPLVYRFGIAQEGIDAFTWDTVFRKTVVSRLDSIGYGLLAAWLHFYKEDFWKRWKWPSMVLGLFLLYFAIYHKGGHGTIYRQTLYLSLVPFCVLFFLPIAATLHSAKGWWARIIEHISKISYSMYLINLALVAEVIRDNFPVTDTADAYMKYFIYWAIVIVVSTLLYKYFEKPIMNMRERFTVAE